MAELPLLELLKDAAMSFCNILFNHTQDGVYFLDKDKNIVYWNHGAEQITGRKRDDVLGKRYQSELVLLVDETGETVSGDKCPVDLTLEDGTIRNLDAYYQHREGYRVPVSLRIIPLFKEDGEVIGVAQVFTGSSPKVTIPLSVAELEKTNLLDTETWIPNRKYLEMHLAARLEEYQKYSLPFGMIYVDVDNYGKISERFGRFNAAKILRLVARTLQKNIRYFDIVGRWDMEEFIIVLLNIDETRLDIVANKLRLLVAESYLTIETGVLNCTVSMGACLVQKYDTIESLIKRAEQLMLHSKWLGRNKVSLTFSKKDL